MRNPVQQYLEHIVAACATTEGEVASYIPELAAADPDGFALCLATVDGQLYEVGDVAARYSIQSISKPFTYALALHDRGTEAVSAKVGVEPSGDRFNEISLAPGTGRPFNPMINAGAITAASLVAGDTGTGRFDRLLDWYARFAGRDLDVDEAVYRSEIATAHRNRAIAHMLREFAIVEDDPEAVLDTYIRQCAVSVDTRDLARMAATLANGGCNPGTGDQVLPAGAVEHVLSVMTTCGMYDAAGDWVSAVGMPAKSGVSGAIIGVLPGQVGVAVYSPRLDGHGNSARGVTLFQRMSADMELHIMHVSRGSRSALRSSSTLLQARSRRRRPAREQDVLDAVGDRCRIYELHGDLLFAGAESIVRRVVQDEPELAVLDVSHVNDIAEVSRRTLLALRDRLREEGAEGVVVDPVGVLPDPDAGTQRATRTFADLAAAVEWCEGELLRRHAPAGTDGADPLTDHPLHDLDPADLTAVRARMSRRTVPAGAVALQGGAAAGISLILHGRAVARDREAEGEEAGLLTLGPGTSCSELALGSDARRQTDLVADTDLELLVLSAADLDRLAEEDPVLAMKVWRAMARDAYRVADRAVRGSVAPQE